jgi:hypothetical protein
MSVSKIPQTDSIEELARFWDRHDLTDFEDELEEVSDPVFERETCVRVSVPSQVAQSLKDLKDLAESKGLDDATLIRQWVLERVHTH